MLGLVAFLKVGKVCLQFIDRIVYFPSYGPVRDIVYMSVDFNPALLLLSALCGNRLCCRRFGKT